MIEVNKWERVFMSTLAAKTKRMIELHGSSTIGYRLYLGTPLLKRIFLGILLVQVLN